MEIEKANDNIGNLEEAIKQLRTAIEKLEASKLHRVNDRKDAEIKGELYTLMHVENANRLLRQVKSIIYTTNGNSEGSE